MDRSVVELERVTHFFEVAQGKAQLALRDVSIRVDEGQFVSIVGPSGCGKSTMLGLIAGLNQPSFGAVSVGGSPVNALRKDVGFILQRDALLPWKTALDNVMLALKFRGIRRKEAEPRAREWLDRVGLDGFEHAYPHQLSGGMRKRVAVAATMVYEPRILLMDEPFSALDVQTRNLMENDLLHLWQEYGDQTVVFVTHDLEEAIGLSDRIVVLSAGPGHVVGDHPVDLPRPRDLLDIRFADGFADLHEKIWGNLRGEVEQAYLSETARHKVEDAGVESEHRTGT